MKDPVQRCRGIPMAILILVLFAVLCTAPVFAFTVAGAKYSGSILPGETVHHTITVVIGQNEDPADLLVEVMGFGQNPNLGYITLDPASDVNPYSARTYITLDRSSLHVEPGGESRITAAITLPKNIGAGGRYALIYIHAIPRTGKSFTTGIIIPVMITVSGTTLTETGSITGLNVSDVIVGQSIAITTTLKNTGNFHFYHIQNTVTLTDANGNGITNTTTQPSNYALLPGSTVQFVVIPEVKNLPAGTYTADSKILFEDGKILDEKAVTFHVKTAYIPPPEETSITVNPGSSSTLVSPDGRYSVTFPQGSVTGDSRVILKPYPRDQLQSAPDGAKLGTSSFEITGLAGLLIKNATVRVVYSADDLAAAGGDTSRLKLAYWDEVQGEWVIRSTQVNTQDTSLTATTNHLSVWAVVVSSSTTGTTPAEGPTKSPLPAFVSLGALIAATIIFSSVARQRK